MNNKSADQSCGPFYRCPVYSLCLLSSLQIFGQQQTFNQSLLGTGQQNFQAINNQMNTINQNQQYTVQVGENFVAD